MCAIPVAWFTYGSLEYQIKTLFKVFDCNGSRLVESAELSVMVLSCRLLIILSDSEHAAGAGGGENRRNRGPAGVARRKLQE